ncbi:MAG: 50S ribosomal protein L19 [Planctomycetota bacterium]|nr:50S ribosomal protein L19 [Planctomycetota bacterium]
MTSKQELLKQVEESSLREDPLHFEVGDTVDVHTRILEGDKERVQVFSGIVIARRGGGTRETFTVRRIVAGEGVERTFPVHSPKIAKLEIKRHGKTRRSKLFYLRERVGKKTRLAERRVLVPGTPAPEDEAIPDDAPVAVEEVAEEVVQETDSEETAE